MNDLLLRAARGERTERPPVWLMRQAGRHLPEYREVRAEYSFIEAVKTPEIAAEITLQPWERYRPDGLVMFSDILTVLEPLGFDYHVGDGTGPVIQNPVTNPADVPIEAENVRSSLDYVGDLLKLLVDEVGQKVPIIGFAGGPFTLASYALTGGSSRNHLEAKAFRAQEESAFRRFLTIISDVVHDYVEFQIESGADIIQLFDTYAGVLTPADYREFVLPFHQKILSGLDVPTIIFVRGMAGQLDVLDDSDADVIGLDWTIDMQTARSQLGTTPVQGNLDPSYLFGDPAFIETQTKRVIDDAGPAGHILNLGHGVHKDTPVSGVKTFVETAKSMSR